ncbi:MAG: YggT family protein [Epsilonproteobacteria bacterium]|nr:YggT family protein [Campylobacterota bacterium]
MVIATLLQAIASILHMVINLYIWVIIIAALISWVQPNPHNPIVQTLYRLSEPAYRLVRRYIPTVVGGIDLAPLVIIIALQFIDLFVVNLLMRLAYRLGS